MDDDLSYYSFIPVLGSDGSVIAVPYLGMSDSSEGVGALNDSLLSSSSSVEDSEIDLQADKSNVQVVQDLESYNLDESLKSFSLASSPTDIPPDSYIGTEPSQGYLDFYGAVWIEGHDPSNQDGQDHPMLYFLPDTKNYWGTDSRGVLMYFGSSQAVGVCPSSVYVDKTVRCSSFGYPYMFNDNHQKVELLIVPDGSNAMIATQDIPRVGLSDALPLFIAACLGVCLLFLSRLHR